MRQLLQRNRGRLRNALLVAGCVLGAPTRASVLAAWAVILPGAALHLWTKGCLRIGAEVTTSGPYRWVRHPFYAAVLVLDVGLCVAIRDPWIAAAYLPVWAAVHWATIRAEESGMTALFGDRYAAYRARVPALFPVRGPASGLAPSAGFSWDSPQLAVGVEYARLVRAFAAPLVVFVGHAIVARLRGASPGGHAPEVSRGFVVAAAALTSLALADRALVLRSARLKARAA